MELKFFLITSLSLILSIFVLTPCASHQLLHHSQPSDHLGDNYDRKVSLDTDSVVALPRKLKFNEVKGYEDEELVAQKNEKKDLSVEIKGNGIASRGTRQEWIEKGEKANSEFFTMDYSHVRRRRPIHNKSVPLRP